MKAKINRNGRLFILRGKEYVECECRISAPKEILTTTERSNGNNRLDKVYLRSCNHRCPHFGEPEPQTDAHAESNDRKVIFKHVTGKTLLKLCYTELVLEELIDERQ